MFMGRTKKPRARARARTEAAYFRTAPNTSRLEILFNPVTGQVSAGMDCETAFTAVTYERENAKQEKTVNKLFTPTGEPALDADAALDLFGVSVAIDTNTRLIRGRRRSVTGIVIADKIAWGVPFCMEAADLPVGEEERLGWGQALVHLLRHGFLKLKESTAIVVDAHLGALESINRREQELVDGLLIPKPWKLCYASADVGAEFRPNQLIRHADRASAAVLNYIQSVQTAMPRSVKEGAQIGEWRLIRGRNPFSSWAELHEQLLGRSQSR